MANEFIARNGLKTPDITPTISTGLSINGITLFKTPNANNDGGVVTTSISTLESVGWTAGSGWSGDNITGFTHTSGGGTATLTNNTGILSNRFYIFTLTLTNRTTGSVNINVGGFGASGYSGNATVLFLSSSGASLVITPTNDFNGTVKFGLTRVDNNTTPTIQFRNTANTTVNEMRIVDTDSLFIGSSAGRFVYPGGGGVSNNVIGQYAGKNLVTGSFNNFIGWDAGGATTSGSYNMFVGGEAGRNNTTGSSNMCIGYKAGRNNSTGNSNTFIGTSAGETALAGGNIGIGATAYSLGAHTGQFNISIGFNSMSPSAGTAITGSHNISIGANSMRDIGSNSNTIGIGQESFRFITGSQSNSIGIGYRAGRHVTNTSTNLTGATNSIYLGADAYAGIQTPTNEIVIGSSNVGLGSNSVILGNSSITLTGLRGQVGVNTTAPNASAQLQVDSTTKGFLPPRMTSTERGNISSPAEGLFVFDTTTKTPWYFNGTSWIELFYPV